MKDQLLEFLEWIPENIQDIYDILDDPEEVVNSYLKYLED